MGVRNLQPILQAVRAVLLTLAFAVSTAAASPSRAAPGGSPPRPVCVVRRMSDADMARLSALDITAGEIAFLPAATRTVLSHALRLDAVGRFANAVAVVEKRRVALPANAAPTERRTLAIVLADAHYEWGRKEELRNGDTAVAQFQAALALDSIYRRKQAGHDTLWISQVYLDREPTRAMRYVEQALVIADETNDLEGKADALNNLGRYYDDVSRYEEAIEPYSQALSLWRTVKNRREQAYALQNIGLVCAELSEYDRAMGYFAQALHIAREVGDRRGQAMILGNIGGTDAELGLYDQARICFEQAFHLSREVKDWFRVASALLGGGITYDDLSQYDQATSFFDRALAVGREFNDRGGEACALGGLGISYDHRNQYGKAIGCFGNALLIFRELKNRDGEANALNSLGEVYEHLGQHEKAIRYYNGALVEFRAVHDRDGGAADLDDMMRFWSNPKFTGRNPALAILWGKQAVNAYQSIRRDIKRLDTRTQKTYVVSKEKTYRTLADVLVSQGRLPEAEQVLDLLKQQETFDFVRRDAQYADVLDGDAALNADERAAYTDYERDADQLARFAQQEDSLNQRIGNAAPTTEQKAQLSALDQHLQAASAVFQRFLDQLPARFGSRKPGTAESGAVEAVAGSRELTDSLLDLREASGMRPVAVYTLVGPDALSLIVINPDVPTPVARRVPIQDADLNRLVEQFKAALTNPTSDPKPAAAKLYDLLIKPIEPDLAAAKPTLILWSLDGALRYVPMAALWDGKQYLVECYASALFTLKAADKLREAPRTDGSGLALATTQALPGFPPLAGADEEAHLFGKPDGIVPGDRLEDADFSKDAFFRSLSKDPTTRKVAYSAVHVASHFDLQPAGDASSSFLLLGDGEHLSVSDMQTRSSTLFRGVDLLVLSACNTATAGIASSASDSAGKAADAGGEFEGFSNVLVGMGTESVLASLWEVSDVGTPPLMRAFYEARTGSATGSSGAAPAVSKALALQRAQLACLSGAARPGHLAGGTGGDSPERSAALKVRPAGSFVVDPARPLAHPYYWAAFVLIGNPR
jgi:CHAT domain-containing protein/Tfp pilus assembly protein PilF